ncbi:DUF362 domain-containing protein, partial [bacterium]|nr:DUF362 domain-containing protein [bacterium]
MDRREFIKKSFLTLSATAMGLKNPSILKAVPADKIEPNPILAVETSNNVRKTDGSYDENFIIGMLDKGITKVTGSSSSSEAWKSLFTKSDTIGIKVNTLAGKMFATRVELVRAIVKILIRSGFDESKIIIFDRSTKELENAGYKINNSRSSLRCIGSNPDGGGYSDNFIVFGEIGSRPSRILESCTAIINVPLLKDHGIAGITCALKNFLGTIDNPHKYHMNCGDPYIADLNASNEIRKRNRLTILDGMTAQYHMGPAFEAAYSWNYNTILMSRDPVAVDTYIHDLIEKKRVEKSLPSLKEAGRFPKYISTASDPEHKVGISEI